MIFIPLLLVLVAIFLVFVFLKLESRPRKSEVVEGKWRFASIYRKRTYLFDSNTEFRLFKILNELFGDKFYIFAQVNYSHVVEVKIMNTYDMRPYRSKIDKKSADFVLCDKERVVPQLVIELDGFSHENDKKKERDNFIDELMKDVGLPILHLKTENMDKEFIKGELEKALAIK